MFHSSSELNNTGWTSFEYDRLLARASAEGDLQRRGELLQLAERILLESMPFIPLYFYTRTRMVKPWVSGFESNYLSHHRTKDLKILAH